MTEHVQAVTITVAALIAALLLLLVVPPGLSGEPDPCQAWLERHGTPHEHC